MNMLGNYIKFLGKQNSILIEEAVEKFLPKGKKLTYLDCGCDDGVKTMSRAKVIGSKKIYCLEQVSGRAILARKKGMIAKTANLDSRWPIKSGSIDIITATEVVEHLVNLDNFFSEVKRVLKRGGKIIISTENLASWHNIFALIVGNQPYTGPYLSKIHSVGHRPGGKYYKSKVANSMGPHINVMTSKALGQLLDRHGFKDVKKTGVGFYPVPNPVSRIMAKLDKYHASYVVSCASK